VCDDLKNIIYYQIGWPGSVYDSTVFSHSDLYRNSLQFFSEGQFLLADAGYGATYFICTPYRQPAASIPHNKIFNELFSSARVVIEHVNGILKGRWSSLRGLRTQIREKKDFKMINEWILVCLILHNLMIRFQDDWQPEADDDDNNDDDENNRQYNSQHHNDLVNVGDLRLKVQDHLLRWFYFNNNNN
jgi:hypothetical protein